MGNTKDFYRMFDQPIDVRSYPVKVAIPPELLSSLLPDERDQFKATSFPGFPSESGFGNCIPSWEMHEHTGTPINPPGYPSPSYAVSVKLPKDNDDDDIDIAEDVHKSVTISKMRMAIHDIEKAITVAQSGRNDYRSYIERARIWLEDL